uniref:Uncharacterized protein n=1 Tax=Anopheles merus TaxID=30066 RepID=A0A182V0D9_ANOME
MTCAVNWKSCAPALQQPIVRQLVQHDQLDQHAQLLPAPLRIDTTALLLLLRLASVAVIVAAQLQVLPDDGAIAGPLLVAPLPDALQQRLQQIAGHQAAGVRCPVWPGLLLQCRPEQPQLPGVERFVRAALIVLHFAPRFSGGRTCVSPSKIGSPCSRSPITLSATRRAYSSTLWRSSSLWPAGSIGHRRAGRSGCSSSVRVVLITSGWSTSCSRLSGSKCHRLWFGWLNAFSWLVMSRYLPVVAPVEPEVPKVFIAHLEPGERTELGQQARRKLLDRLVLPPDRRVPDAAQAEPAGVDAARQKDARLDREHVQVPERLQMVPVVVAVRGELGEDRADEGRYRLGRPGQREPARAQKQKPERHVHRHVRAVRHVLEADARPEHADGAQHAQAAGAGQHERQGEQQHHRAVLDHLAADEPGQAGGRLGRTLVQPDALLDEVLQVVVERLDGRLAGGAGVPQPDRDRTPAHHATVRLAVQHLLELGQPLGEGGSATIAGSVRLLRRLRRAHCVVLRLLLLLLLLPLWSIAREGNVLPQQVGQLLLHPAARRLDPVPVDEVPGDGAQLQQVGPQMLQYVQRVRWLEQPRDRLVPGGEVHQPEGQRGARRRHVHVHRRALLDLERGQPVLFLLRADHQPPVAPVHVVVERVGQGEIVQRRGAVAEPERHQAEGEPGRQRVRLPLDVVLHLRAGRAANLLQQHLDHVPLGRALVEQADAEQGRHLQVLRDVQLDRGRGQQRLDVHRQQPGDGEVGGAAVRRGQPHHQPQPHHLVRAQHVVEDAVQRQLAQVPGQPQGHQKPAVLGGGVRAGRQQCAAAAALPIVRDPGGGEVGRVGRLMLAGTSICWISIVVPRVTSRPDRQRRGTRTVSVSLGRLEQTVSMPRPTGSAIVRRQSMYSRRSCSSRNSWSGVVADCGRLIWMRAALFRKLRTSSMRRSSGKRSCSTSPSIPPMPSSSWVGWPGRSPSSFGAADVPLPVPDAIPAAVGPPVGPADPAPTTSISLISCCQLAISSYWGVAACRVPRSVRHPLGQPARQPVGAQLRPQQQLVVDGLQPVRQVLPAALQVVQHEVAQRDRQLLQLVPGVAARDQKRQHGVARPLERGGCRLPARGVRRLQCKWSGALRGEKLLRKDRREMLAHPALRARHAVDVRDERQHVVAEIVDAGPVRERGVRTLAPRQQPLQVAKDGRRPGERFAQPAEQGRLLDQAAAVPPVPVEQLGKVDQIVQLVHGELGVRRQTVEEVGEPAQLVRPAHVQLEVLVQQVQHLQKVGNRLFSSRRWYGRRPPGCSATPSAGRSVACRTRNSQSAGWPWVASPRRRFFGSSAQGQLPEPAGWPAASAARSSASGGPTGRPIIVKSSVRNRSHSWCALRPACEPGTLRVLYQWMSSSCMVVVGRACRSTARQLRTRCDSASGASDSRTSRSLPNTSVKREPVASRSATIGLWSVRSTYLLPEGHVPASGTGRTGESRCSSSSNFPCPGDTFGRSVLRRGKPSCPVLLGAVSGVLLLLSALGRFGTNGGRAGGGGGAAPGPLAAPVTCARKQLLLGSPFRCSLPTAMQPLYSTSRPVGSSSTIRLTCSSDTAERAGSVLMPSTFSAVGLYCTSVSRQARACRKQMYVLPTRSVCRKAPVAISPSLKALPPRRAGRIATRSTGTVATDGPHMLEAVLGCERFAARFLLLRRDTVPVQPGQDVFGEPGRLIGERIVRQLERAEPGRDGCTGTELGGAGKASADGASASDRAVVQRAGVTGLLMGVAGLRVGRVGREWCVPRLGQIFLLG